MEISGYIGHTYISLVSYKDKGYCVGLTQLFLEMYVSADNYKVHL